MATPGWPTQPDNPRTPPRKNPARNHAEQAHGLDDATRGPRLHKVLAEAGVGSRRTCEALIEEGVVAVNGHVVTKLPAWVDPARDRITVRGKRVGIVGGGDHAYVMLFKPRGVVCTNDDPEGRQRAIDLVDHPKAKRLYAVGRLDIESSGLLLLTNDGELANRLTHPRYGVHKTYEVTVAGALDEAAVRKLSAGVFLNERRTSRGKKPGRKTGRSKLTLLRTSRDRTLLKMELTEGRNRQIRRMMLEVGHAVKKLRRIQMGPLKLRGLQPGQWRELTYEEIRALKRAAFGKEGKS